MPYICSETIRRRLGSVEKIPPSFQARHGIPEALQDVYGIKGIGGVGFFQPVEAVAPVITPRAVDVVH
jgi:hypothetical protein